MKPTNSVPDIKNERFFRLISEKLNGLDRACIGITGQEELGNQLWLLT
jgi:hypothetical protein